MTADVWMTCFEPKPEARLRLIVFPYAGAGTAGFRSWGAGLPRDVELCAVRLPGRETRLREKPYTAMKPLVDELGEAIQPYLDKPFVFYGHSMGALVAFEVIRYLRRKGKALPLHLIISARRAPQMQESDVPIHMLQDDAFVEKMQERYGAIPDVILQSEELMALFVPVLKADFAVIETYQYEADAPLDIPISAYGGSQDRVLRVNDIEGWRERTTRTFTSQMFTGAHFFIQTQQSAFVAAVGKLLVPSSKSGEPPPCPSSAREGGNKAS